MLLAESCRYVVITLEVLTLWHLNSDVGRKVVTQVGPVSCAKLVEDAPHYCLGILLPRKGRSQGGGNRSCPDSGHSWKFLDIPICATIPTCIRLKRGNRHAFDQPRKKSARWKTAKLVLRPKRKVAIKSKGENGVGKKDPQQICKNGHFINCKMTKDAWQTFYVAPFPQRTRGKRQGQGYAKTKVSPFFVWF